jgi:hypothetical protein
VTPSPAHAELIATFKRAEADAAHKFGLIKAAEKKGPRPFRRPLKLRQRQPNAAIHSPKKLEGLGVNLKD